LSDLSEFHRDLQQAMESVIAKHQLEPI